MHYDFNVSISDEHVPQMKFYEHCILCDYFNSLTVCFGIAWGC